MKSSLHLFILMLASGLTACHKQPAPAQADMDAASRQKAVEIRAASDKETAALKEAAANQEAARKAAEAKEILNPGSTVPTPAPAVPAPAPAPPK